MTKYITLWHNNMFKEHYWVSNSLNVQNRLEESR